MLKTKAQNYKVALKSAADALPAVIAAHKLKQKKEKSAAGCAQEIALVENLIGQIEASLQAALEELQGLTQELRK